MLWLVDRYTLTDNTESNFIVCPQTFLIRFFALLIPSIFIPFLLTSLHTAHILVEHEKNPTSPQAFERLIDIVNPVAWQGRLDAAVNAHILIRGLHDKDDKKLEKYLTWALKLLKHKPRESLYENSLLVLKTLGRNEDYKLLLKEAERTYPQHTNWQNSILQSKKPK
jgi:O-antigen polymerase